MMPRTAAQDARYRADQPRRASGRADPDVRRAGPCGRRLSRAADQGRLPGRHRRADRKPGGSEEARRIEDAGGARHRPLRHRRHADRGSLLEPRRANVLAAVCECAGSSGIAACDISTGRMELEECPADGSARRWRGWAPAKWSAPKTGTARRRTRRSPRPARDFASDAGEARLKALHGVATLDGFGAFTRADAGGGGRADRLSRSCRARHAAAAAAAGRAREATAHLAMDEATRASLEMLRLQPGQPQGQPDRRDRPLRHRRRRAAAGRRPLRAADRYAGDRCAAGTGAVAPRRCRCCARTCAACCARCPISAARWGGWSPGAAARAISASCATGWPRRGGCATISPGREDRPGLLEDLLPALAGHGALTDLYARALVPSAADRTRRRAASSPRATTHALDELRRTSGNARRAIAALEAKYRDETGIAALKIRHNGVLGYFIEVPAKHADPLMAPDSGFTHRQTMAGAVRFNALALHEEASRIAEAGGHALAAEEAHFEELVAMAVAARHAIAATAAGARPDRCRRRAGRARGRRRLVPAAIGRRAGARHRRRTASGGRGGAGREGRALRRQ